MAKYKLLNDVIVKGEAVGGVRQPVIATIPKGIIVEGTEKTSTNAVNTYLSFKYNDKTYLAEHGTYEKVATTVADQSATPQPPTVYTEGYEQKMAMQQQMHNLFRTMAIISAGASIGYFIGRNKKIGGTYSAIIGGSVLLTLACIASQFSGMSASAPPPVTEFLGISTREIYTPKTAK